MASALNWFEIPASDIERAIAFYETILQQELVRMEANDGYPMGMFPVESGVSGAVIQGEGYTPSTAGTVVYLNGGDDLSLVLQRVDDAGGQTLMGKTDIGENGFMAYFLDSEGNRVGLHSMS
ncbi:MAG: VOC family protein [Candidatus Promineifilaceae bacterium]|nr:VOC family protein [Candidatus Promineifilaceae bacterium]